MAYLGQHMHVIIYRNLYLNVLISKPIHERHHIYLYTTSDHLRVVTSALTLENEYFLNSITPPLFLHHLKKGIIKPKPECHNCYHQCHTPMPTPEHYIFTCVMHFLANATFILTTKCQAFVGVMCMWALCIVCQNLKAVTFMLTFQNSTPFTIQ